MSGLLAGIHVSTKVAARKTRVAGTYAKTRFAL
jgi:hypothetical protein